MKGIKKFIIIEAILYVISIIGYITFLILNKGKSEFYFYESHIVYFGFILPFIHIIMIMLKQILNDDYLGSKYDSIMSYFIALASGFVFLLCLHAISEEWFNKAHIFMWILEPVIYIIFVTLGIVLEKKDKKKEKNINIKVNR